MSDIAGASLSRYEFNQDGILPIIIENRGPTQPGLVNYLLKDVILNYKY